MPHVERGEAINAGVVVFCRQQGFLEARVALDRARLRAIAPGVDPEPIREQLAQLERVIAGDPSAGPVAALEPSERFHWLAAPSSTVIQPSAVHTGLCDDPPALLERLFATLVEPPGVAGMRRAYELGGLDESDLAPTWHEQFRQWFVDAGPLAEPNAMIVATTAPNARIVLLKGFDERGLVFYTDLDSAKGFELIADPRVAVVFPWHELERQVRFVGEVERLTDEENDAYFASRPLGSQLSAAASRQSQVVGSRAELEAVREELAAFYPDAVPRPSRWGGVRIVPHTVEFWQGRPDRLHDRLRFRRDDHGGWIVERLSP